MTGSGAGGGPITPRPQNIENNPMQSSVNMPEGYLFSEKQKNDLTGKI
jgi:hypothetical protein